MFFNSLFCIILQFIILIYSTLIVAGPWGELLVARVLPPLSGLAFTSLSLNGFFFVVDQRWPELIRDIESATGAYARARAGAAGDVNIPRYQCRPVY